MTEVIIVASRRGAWTVGRWVKNSSQTFRSGATAQAAAQQLGDAIARGGKPAEVQILMRDGSVAERFLFPALRGPEAKKGAP
jgi:hypothetical protein